LIEKLAGPAILGAALIAFAGIASAPAAAAGGDAETIIRNTCGACHTENGEGSGQFSRISQQRKTPEGWQVTINRMEHLRGLRLSPEDKRTVIKYLADTRGLAPSEAAPYRYLLEQDTNRVEAVSPDYAQMCARCHSGARFGLQRRSEEEWKLLVQFHVAQHPTLEFHSMSRDRPWFQLAMNETSAKLVKDFPLATDAWRKWQAAPKPALGGDWNLVGYVPGKGEFAARMRAEPTGTDQFRLAVDGRYADGSPLRGAGSATVFTGYEWRGALEIDGAKMRQVLAAQADGGAMAGRMFRRDAEADGGELRVVKADGAPQVVAVMPSHLRKGAAQQITVVGSGLDGEVSLGQGVTVEKVVSRSADRVTVIAHATGKAGARDVAVGSARAPGALAVYERLARVEVLPADAVARIGGGGGAMEKIGVAYRAVGYAAGPDGKAGTGDDLKLGYMPATWAIAPADHTAEEELDHKFAGSIDVNGVFTPGDAGPNPQRKMSANNVGRLTVVATVDDRAKAVRGHGRLLVSVPDFVQEVLD
jgi:quinohemoprotein amine dehydrogenase